MWPEKSSLSSLPCHQAPCHSRCGSQRIPSLTFFHAKDGCLDCCSDSSSGSPSSSSRTNQSSLLCSRVSPWLLFALAQDYPYFPNVTGAIKGFEGMLGICVALLVGGSYALANAAAGSIAQYTL